MSHAMAMVSFVAMSSGIRSRKQSKSARPTWTIPSAQPTKYGLIPLYASVQFMIGSRYVLETARDNVGNFSNNFVFFF